MNNHYYHLYDLTSTVENIITIIIIILVQRLKSDSSSSSSSSSSSCGSKRKTRSMILGSFSSNNAFSYCISDGTSRRANNATSLDHRKGKILDEGKGDNNEEKEDGGLVYKSSFDNSHSSHHHHHHDDKVGILMAIETSKTKNHHDQISQQELLDNNKKERNSIARCHLHCETSGILRSISSSPSSSLLPTCGYSNYTSQISPETVIHIFVSPTFPFSHSSHHHYQRHSSIYTTNACLQGDISEGR